MLRAFDLFDEMFKDPFFSRAYRGDAAQLMKTDIKEEDQSYKLDIELPGYQKEDVQAELKDGYLTISANTSKNEEEKDEQGRYIRRERYSGVSRRSFYVGEHVKQEDVSAQFKDGVLSLRVPKDSPQQLEDKTKLIEIQ